MQLRTMFGVVAVCAASIFGATAQAADGLLSISSPHPVNTTVDRLEGIVEKAGFKVFARVDHGAGAASVGMPLRPTQLLIFGNPKGGTALMQSVGIDLPLKYLVWAETDGTVRIGWNEPAWVLARHAITDKAKVEKKMTGGLNKFATEAAKP